MSQILLLLEHKENRRLLSEWLTTRYQVTAPDLDLELQDQATSLLEQSFDLCILDARALDRYWEAVQAKKQAEKSVFLPFLVITSRRDVGMVTRHLWQNIDDLITKPIEKVELQARVEILLRSRQYSLQLKAANQEIKSEIAERQQIEEALVKNEVKFCALVQNSSDAIQVLAADGTITYASPSCQNILGFSPEELEGKNAFDFIHPDDLLTATAPFRACLTKLSDTPISEYRFRHKGGSWRYLESKSNFVHNDPNLQGIVVNLRDVTERKQAEQSRLNALKKEQELYQLKSHFISMVSHEFRNPLNGILAATQILERYSENWSKDKKQEFFERIKTGIRTMTELIDDVLIIGQAEAKRLEIKPTPLDLKKLTHDLVQEIKLNTESKHIFRIITTGQCDNACLDEKLLRHILTNLISNAIKYSPRNSTITFKLTNQNKEVIFQLQDQGIGIPPEDLEQLFESFHRAANVKNIPGTGLGLAIVKRCVDLQGGKITVNSEVGVGTTFTVTLPLSNLVTKEVNSLVPKV